MQCPPHRATSRFRYARRDEQSCEWAGSRDDLRTHIGAGTSQVDRHRQRLHLTVHRRTQRLQVPAPSPTDPAEERPGQPPPDPRQDRAVPPDPQKWLAKQPSAHSRRVASPARRLSADLQHRAAPPRPRRSDPDTTYRATPKPSRTAAASTNTSGSASTTSTSTAQSRSAAPVDPRVATSISIRRVETPSR